VASRDARVRLAAAPQAPDRALPAWALWGAGFTLLAVALEFLGSIVGDSPSTGYPGWLVPIAWPTAVRVLWWVAAAVGAVALNRGLARATGHPRRLATVVTALPFLGFALGIALGAEWATWH
jgi:hypothetical protein